MDRKRRNPLELWHLLSLDAPTVAALWCWTLARGVGEQLPKAAPFLLALGTWLLYVCDRLLDGALPPHPAALRERHRFHIRHRRSFIAACFAAALVLLWAVPRHVLPSVLRGDALLGLCALLYLGVVHLRPPELIRRFPKEVIVGLVFAAAVGLPAWARSMPERGARGVLLLLLGLFAVLCWLNCAAIEAWESGAASRTGNAAQPLRSTQWIGRHLASVSAAAALLCCFAMILLASRVVEWPLRTAAVLGALALSAACLGVLDRVRGRLTPLQLRIGADLALLTPLLFLPALVR